LDALYQRVPDAESLTRPHGLQVACERRAARLFALEAAPQLLFGPSGGEPFSRQVCGRRGTLPAVLAHR